jgi:hypothetical protein
MDNSADSEQNEKALQDLQEQNMAPRISPSRSHPAMRWFLLGAGASLAGVYFLHPIAGARRRAMLIATVGRAAYVGDVFWVIGRLAAEIRQSSESLYAQTMDSISRKLHRSYSEVLAQKVAAAVRKRLPDAAPVEVRVDNGVVTLRGPVVSDQIKSLIQMVESMPGVKQVIDQLQAQKSANQHLL